MLLADSSADWAGSAGNGFRAYAPCPREAKPMGRAALLWLIGISFRSSCWCGCMADCTRPVFTARIAETAPPLHKGHVVKAKSPGVIAGAYIISGVFFLILSFSASRLLPCGLGPENTHNDPGS